VHSGSHQEPQPAVYRLVSAPQPQRVGTPDSDQRECATFREFAVVVVCIQAAVTALFRAFPGVAGA
jgi:hypothetical protein